MKKLLWKLFWFKQKPYAPCVFVTRYKDSKNIIEYEIWILEWIYSDGGRYLGWLDKNYEEWDDYDEFELGDGKTKIIEWK